MGVNKQSRTSLFTSSGDSTHIGQAADNVAHIAPVHTQDVLHASLLRVLPAAAVQRLLLLAVQLQVPPAMRRQSAQYLSSGISIDTSHMCLRRVRGRWRDGDFSDINGVFKRPSHSLDLIRNKSVPCAFDRKNNR